MSVTIKMINGTSKEVSVPDFNITVEEFKKLSAPVVDIPYDEQRVVLKGKVLKDGDLLTALGMESGSVVHIVKSKKKAAEATPAVENKTEPTTSTTQAAPAPATSANANPYGALSGWGAGGTTNTGAAPTGGFGGNFGGLPQGGVGGFQPTPEQAMQMMQDPFMQQMMQEMARNPQLLQQMMQASPYTANMSPEMMQLSLQMMQNPQMMQLMMGMAGSGAQQNAGGNSAAQQGGFQLPQNNMFAPPQPQGDPREIYREQLQQLREMGFPNEDANIAALQQSQGNLSFAIERLFNP